MTRFRNTGFLVLVGFMGAGKTTVGRILASQLGWRFVDLDDVIEANTGRKIADIFRDSGEAAFRQAETAALRGLLDEAPHALVLALGGGAFVQPENARLIGEAGVPVIFLDASVEELRRRCAPKSDQRPLFRDENQFRQLYEARRHAYMRAEIHIDTTGVTVEEAAAEVLRRLEFDAAGAKPNV